MHVALGVPQAWVQPQPPPPPQPAPTPAAPQPVQPPKKNSGCGTLVAIAFAILAVLFLLGQCTDRSSQPTPSKTSKQTSPPKPQATEADKQRLAMELLQRVEDPNVSTAGRIATAQALVRNYSGSAQAAKAAALLPKLQAEQAEEEKGKQWKYGSYEDSMSGKQVFTATVNSTNSFQFDFPYQGIQHARLTLRRHPRWGNDVIFAIEKGQILCHTYNCRIRVRFDDAPAQTFTGNEPEDNSSELVFIPAYSTFAKKLPQAKRVRIEVAIFQQGNIIADFDVSGFKPEKLQASK